MLSGFKKLKYCQSGFLKHPTQSGRIVIDGGGAEDEEVEVDLSDDLLEAIMMGDYGILCGHAESWLSAIGRLIIKKLREKDMIGAICIDELHKSLRWLMRPKMQDAPAVLKNKARDAWCIG